MNKIQWLQRLWGCLPFGLVVLLTGSLAYAADSGANWRPTYDLVMRWVNFLILVFILVKFGKNPIKKFLFSQREKIEKEIKAVETQRKQVADQIKEYSRQLEESQERFVELKNRIVRQGERKKEQIIEDARQESRILLENAKRKIDYQFFQAQERLKGETIDAAIQLASQRLQSEITDNDNQLILTQYIAEIASQ